MKKLILMTVVFCILSVNAFAGSITEKSPGAVGDILGLVIDTTNESNATTTYYYLDNVLDGYTAFSAQHKILAVTVTYEGSNDLSSVSNATATWTDITSMLTDGVALSFTATGFLSVNQHIPWARLRIKRLTTSATNELEIRITKTIVR